jgi:hypothetical protein
VRRTAIKPHNTISKLVMVGRLMIVTRKGKAATAGPINEKRAIVFPRDSSFRSGVGESKVPGFVRD